MTTFFAIKREENGEALADVSAMSVAVPMRKSSATRVKFAVSPNAGAGAQRPRHNRRNRSRSRESPSRAYCSPHRG